MSEINSVVNVENMTIDELLDGRYASFEETKEKFTDIKDDIGELVKQLSFHMETLQSIDNLFRTESDHLLSIKRIVDEFTIQEEYFESQVGTIYHKINELIRATHQQYLDVLEEEDWYDR
jgi:hypothetical protein